MSGDVSKFGDLTLNTQKSVTVTQWGKANNEGVRNDSLWNIAKNYGQETLGRELNNEEIAQIMTELAQAREGEGTTQEKLEQTLQTNEEIIIPLKTQLDTLNTAVSEAIQTRQALVSELGELNTKVNECNKNVSEALSAYLAVKDSDDNEAIESAYQAYQQALQELKNAQNEVERKQDEITQTDNEIESLNNELDELKEQIDTTEENCQNEVDELSKTIEEYQKEASAKQEELNNAREACIKANELTNQAVNAGVVESNSGQPKLNEDGSLKFVELNDTIADNLENIKIGDEGDIEGTQENTIDWEFSQEEKDKYFSEGSIYESDAFDELKEEYQSLYGNYATMPSEDLEELNASKIRIEEYCKTVDKLQPLDAKKVMELYPEITDENEAEKIAQKVNIYSNSDSKYENYTNTFSNLIGSGKSVGEARDIVLEMQQFAIETAQRDVKLESYTPAERIYLQEALGNEYNTLNATPSVIYQNNARYIGTLENGISKNSLSLIDDITNKSDEQLKNLESKATSGSDEQKLLDAYDKFMELYDDNHNSGFLGIGDDGSSDAKKQAEAFIKHIANGTVPTSGAYNSIEDVIDALNQYADNWSAQ